MGDLEIRIESWGTMDIARGQLVDTLDKDAECRATKHKGKKTKTTIRLLQWEKTKKKKK